MADLFNQNLTNPETPQIPDDQIRNEINEINEKEYLKKLRKKNRKHLIKLDPLERERIAKHIKDLYNKKRGKQDELNNRLDEYDEVWRMEPISLVGDDGTAPTYRTPLTAINIEVIHANIMNVFFTPKDTMRVIPTEAGDIPKVKKLDTFGNWSMKNEMELFENCDRLFHETNKNGETPYMIHWVKEFGTEIKIEQIMNPADPSQPLLDDDTKEVITQEREISKILYNGPKLEIFSRKDYILPENAVWGKLPDWEMRIVRLNADKVNRRDLEGVYYDGTFDEIGGWGTEVPSTIDNTKLTKEGDELPLGVTEKIFVEYWGRLRVRSIARDEQDQDERYDELEDEFRGVVEMNSETLCELRKNRMPLKMRPFGLDIFMPDGEGRRGGLGVTEFLEGTQKANDALMSQYIFGTVQSNNPFGFFTPTGNMRDEPIKVKSGYLYPTTDPKSVNMVKLPPPDLSLINAMAQMSQNSQLLFGISDFTAGVESKIDPDAPAKKAQFIVAQGNVRLNLIVRRKNATLKDIFKRWFLLYQANMPPNKFMRIAGEDQNNPWKFEPINLTDFALKAIPDFELVGNVLNANKQAEAAKALSVYSILVQNPFFNPQTSEGLQALREATIWLLDKLDETGISNFLPPVKTNVATPEEENARFLQGDTGEPTEGEDHINHIKVHNQLITNPAVPEEIRKNTLDHVQLHTDLLKKQVTQQMVLGGQGGRQGAPQQTSNVVPVGGMGGVPQGAGLSL